MNTITGNDEYVRLDIYEGRLPANAAYEELLRIEKAQRKSDAHFAQLRIDGLLKVIEGLVDAMTPFYAVEISRGKRFLAHCEKVLASGPLSEMVEIEALEVPAGIRVRLERIFERAIREYAADPVAVAPPRFYVSGAFGDGPSVVGEIFMVKKPDVR